MKTLDEIAIKNRTDKSSKTHNYCVKYEKKSLKQVINE